MEKINTESQEENPEKDTLVALILEDTTKKTAEDLMSLDTRIGDKLKRIRNSRTSADRVELVEAIKVAKENSSPSLTETLEEHLRQMDQKATEEGGYKEKE